MKIVFLAAVMFGEAALSPLLAAGRPAAAASDIEKDWMRQDSGRVDVSACFADAKSNTLESGMAEAVVAELERLAAPSAAVRRASLAALLKEGRPGNDPAWRALYLAAARERRALRLKKLVAKTHQVFFTRHCLIAAPGNISSNQHPSDRRGPSSGTGKSFNGKPLYLTWEPGAELCLLTLDDEGNATVETVLETPNGFIRDPALSYDGRTLAFARRERFFTDDFQIYLMDVETRRTTRITAPLSPDYPISNIYPCFLPNGRIMFQSTRCAQLDPCGWDQTGTFFSMRPDGTDIRRLTADQVSTMLPTVMDDGRVLYTRWEYNDRTPVYVQPLFTMNEDGTSQAEFYGNDSWFPTSLMHARGIPGTGKAMAIASGHHTLQKGKLVIVDPRKGTEEEAGIEYICSSAPDGTRGRKAASEIPLKHDKGQHLDGFGQEGPQFAHPFPLGEDNILVSFTADGYQGFGVWGAKSKNPNRKGENFGLFWMDADGRRELLAYDARRNSLEATPVVARAKPFLRGSRVDERQSFGTFYVKDVYHGPGAEGIARGTIKKLRVVALEYRAAWAGSLWAQGPGGDSCAQTPIGLQNCSWDVKHILGEADVAADGSCTFACPAHQAVYFQLIDDKGHCAQTMRSWTHLMGGESASCTGCHESKTESYQGAPAGQAEAKPQRLKPFAGVEHPLLARYEKEGRLASVENYLGVNAVRSFDHQAPIEGFSFERRVQPILDRHCVRCHSPEAKAGNGVKPSKLDLTARKVRRVGDKKRNGVAVQRVFNQSYISLTGNGKPTPTVNWVLQESAPPLQKPYSCGSATSSLTKRLERAHCGTDLTQDEKDTVCAWIDLAVPYCGSYLEGRAWDAEDEAAYARFQRKRVVYAQQELDALRGAPETFAARLAPQNAVACVKSTDGETLPGQGVERLADGEINPTCAWRWQKKPIRVEFDFGEAREIGGVRFTSGRSWVNCGVRTASFYGDGKPLGEHLAFRPANTYRDNYAVWNPAICRRVTMVIEDTYDFKPNYYSFYTHVATPLLPKIFETPPYPEFSGKFPTVQIAEMSFFGATPPDDLPLPNKDGTIAYPESRLVRDWLYQSCAVSNISHLANVEPDTTKPDPMGEDLSVVLKATACGRDPAFLAKHAARRREFLAAFRKEFTQFVYVKHIVMGNSIFHATDDLTDASYQEWKRVPDYTFGGSQLVLASIHEDGSVSQEVLIDKPKGYIRDPNLHFDGKTLVFSMRDNLTDSNYHLFTLDLETRALKQLTFDGLVCAADVPGQTSDFPMPASDIEPCWLPDGSIVFQSTRCSHSVDCWPLPVSNLFRCDADGSHIRRLGFDQVQTFFPQLMDDGRVSYTRWEYNDRSAAGLQQLYAMNPDGTKQTGLFANNSEFPFSLIHTRGIPGTRDIMMISCGHHVGQKGRLAMSRLAEGDDYTSFTYDPAKSVWGMNTNAVVMTFPGNRVMTIPWSPWDNPSGPATTNIPGMYYLAGAAMNAAPGVQPTRQPHDYQYNVFDMHSQFGPQWAYPFPLGGGRLLVSYMPEGCRYYRGPYSSRFGVYAMDETGRRELLAFDWGQHCMQPIPVKRRAPPPRTLAKLDYRDGFGTYYVQDVYAGAAMAGAPKGCVKRIRVIGLEYRPVHIGWNWQYGWHSTQGKIGTPISVGNGAYDVKHVLGEADVEADGSCSFRAPARTPVYFQLIDKDGCCIQTMRSWSTLQPGEVNGCIGCHEHPHLAGVENAKADALRRPPQRLKPWLPGGETHPFIDALEREGPLASLDNWMGLNRPKAVVDSDRNDGFSFSRLVQPILDAKCVSCHDGSGKKLPVGRAVPGEPSIIPAAMDLRGTRGKLPPSDDQSKRKYTTSYLALTYKGKCNEKINFAHGLGFAPFKPPYSFGAAKSGVWLMLKKGHHGVALTDAELRLLACWIDLAVPFCGSYVEHHDWNDWYIQRFHYTCNKRAAFAWQELNDVRREYGMPPVPLTGFVPNVAEPRRQSRWDE